MAGPKWPYFAVSDTLAHLMAALKRGRPPLGSLMDWMTSAVGGSCLHHTRIVAYDAT